MAKQESWEIAYQLVNAADKLTVARGTIKDYPSAEEALDRLGERVGTAVAAELRSLADPAPWKLVLSFEVRRRADAATVEDLAEQLATAGRPRKVTAGVTPAAGDDAEGIDLAEDLSDRQALRMRGLEPID
jgi:hypothetical protein